jgi:hypothetical protein
MSDNKAELAALRASNEKLEARIEELERKAKPPAPINFNTVPGGPTTTQIAINNLGMSPEVHAEFARTVPTGTVRDIVNGNRAPTALAPLASSTARPSVASENRSGWRDAQPLDVPGGATTHKLIERGANVHLPHGPANPVGKGDE